MTTTATLSLPASLKTWVQTQSKEEGYSDLSEFASFSNVNVSEKSEMRLISS
jgi:hypothetical protein